MNNRIKRITFISIIIVYFAMPVWNVHAEEEVEGSVISPQGRFSTLNKAVENAHNGDTLNVYGGVYTGPILIEKSLTLIGHNWPILDGENKGTVIRLTSPNIVLKGFVIINSGKVLDQENSGLSVEAPDIIVEGNYFKETLFGIYLRKASNSVIRDNVIYSKDLAAPRRGDPIRIWFSDNVRIENNRVEKGRDVVLWYSEQLIVRGNDISGGRYGLHIMYCDDAVIEKNRLIGNSVGVFLMYSRNLHLQNNFISENRGPSGFGVGLKDVDDAIIKDNLFLDNRIGVSVDNSPREIDSTTLFEGNVFSFNDVGMKLTPSVRQNYFKGNSFEGNRNQVSVAGGGQLRNNIWTVDGIGNYWSDYAGFDEDLDGRGDIPYKSQKLFENLTDKYPTLLLFSSSPSAESIDFAARALPLVQPQPKLIDNAPLMKIHLPQGLPVTSMENSSRNIGLVSGGMILTAIGLIFLPRFSFFRIPLITKISSITSDCTLRVEGLTKRFGNTTVVDKLNLSVSPGQSVAIWGGNGAGKTTIFHCILGLLSYKGSINIGKLDLKMKDKKIRKLIGFVPQELNLHENLTVLETVHFYARLKKSSRSNIEENLKRMDLLEHTQKQVRQLSGGMKQRLALALALLSDPPILILDEPTASLDSSSRISFLSLISDLKNDGKTIIFTTHVIEDVLNLADKVLILKDGKIAETCNPEEIGRRIGETVKIRIYLFKEQLKIASDILLKQGLSVDINGLSIFVKVPISEKIKPILILTQAEIPIRDFVMESSIQENI
jgi:nitrous oxidase accessory protein